MQIITAVRNYPEATPAVLDEVLTTDPHSREFIILERSGFHFMQTTGGDGKNVLEYREGPGDDQHYCCTNELTDKETAAALHAYLQGDDSWKTTHQWTTLAEKNSKGSLGGWSFL